MNKFFLCLSVVFSVAVSCYSANTLTWYRDDGTVLNTSGNPLPTSSAYTIMLFETASSGASTSIGFNPATQTGGAGETLLASYVWNTWPSVIGAGAFYSDLAGGNIGNVLTGDHIYTVIVNGSVGSSTQYSILDGLSPTTVTLDGASNFDYNVPGNNTWQPVPEPSTVALMVAGLAVVAFGRRAFRK